jgi:hypothetical protein
MESIAKGGPASGLELAQAPQKPPIEMPAITQRMKKQPYYYWRCGFPLGRKKKCPHKDEAAAREKALLEYRSNQHWENHLRDQANLPHEVKPRNSTKGIFTQMKKAAKGNA